MRRTILAGLGLAVVSTTVAAQGGGRGGAGAQASHVALRRDIDAMDGRLSGRPSPQQLIADARVLSSGYRTLVPYVGGFGPADYAFNRDVARRSLDWLGRASVLYGRDPLVAQAILSSYESIGGFYRDYGPFYQPGAFVAYAGATRLAQRLILYGLNPDLYERELNRYSLAYGTIAALNGALLMPWNTPRDLPDSTPARPGPTLAIKPVELPDIDVSKLNAEQKAEWMEARDRFRSVAPRVHGARMLLNELSSRLQQQNMSLRSQDAAEALKMQSFLEDAVDLMREGRFDMAIEALSRAEYVRAKLKSVTGQ